mgnify:CR=1 FL=1
MSKIVGELNAEMMKKAIHDRRHAFAGYSFKFGAYVDNAEWFLPENNYQLLELPE